MLIVFYLSYCDTFSQLAPFDILTYFYLHFPEKLLSKDEQNLARTVLPYFSTTFQSSVNSVSADSD